MNKTLNEDAMKSELAGSAFFAGQQTPTEPSAHDTSSSRLKDAEKPSQKTGEQSSAGGTVTPRHRDTTTPPAAPDKSRIETIRKAVHLLGKEDATYRFTLEEKKALADIVYTYASGGIKTSQNEITRIAVNWLLEDYRDNGKSSVLVRVLDRLNE